MSELKVRQIELARAKAMYEYTIEQVMFGNVLAIAWLEKDRMAYEKAYHVWRNAVLRSREARE